MYGERIYLCWRGFTLLMYVGVLVIKDDSVLSATEIDASKNHTSFSKNNTDTDVSKLNVGCKISRLAASAIVRAQSASCKRQLADVACRIYTGTVIPKKLPRFCPTKADDTKGEYLGSYQMGTYFHQFIQLSIDNRTPEACVNQCFTRGTMYAGLQLNKLKCWCGNKLSVNDLFSEESCEAHGSDDQTSTCMPTDNIKFFSTGLPEMKTTKTSLVYKEDEVRELKPVRLVFVFTVTGRAVRQIRRLLKAIYHVDHYYYIHVDSRADYLYRELMQLELFPNVRLARERLATIWAGSSFLQAHFSILKTLLAMSNWTWDYYINLSETHYPLKNIPSLAMYLQKYQGNNFIQITQNVDPTTDKERNFFECDQHLWLLGKRKLPEGISFRTGPDWMCLHRDFVEYVATGTDPLLTGLKEMYKYTVSPLDSFFHVLLHNSEFCEKWIDEDMHLTHWVPERGCSCQRHLDEVDSCGCSPMVIKQRDFDEIIVNLDKSPKFWSRKFEPIIDQEVLNSIDKLLGIEYKGHQSLHQYWQNEFHILEQPSSTTDLITTFASSFIRRSMQLMSSSKSSCGLAGLELIETHVLNVGNTFDSYLVKFSASRTGSDASYTLECRFSLIQLYRVQDQSVITERLGKLKVGTNFDSKEEIFRNYPGFFGPASKGLTLQYVWKEGAEGNVTFSWVDPSGKTVSTLEKHIGTEITSGVYTLETNSTSMLQTGIWKILVHSDSKEIVEVQFLVLPTVISEEPDSVTQTDQIMFARIDELTAHFWKEEGVCSPEDLGSECPQIKLCSKTEWSSMSPDPKSDIIVDNKGNIAK